MKNKKIVFGIIGFVAVVVIAVVLGLFLHKNKKEVTAENFKVEQGNGVFYLNGGYMILKTRDSCTYHGGDSAYSYDAYTYIYNETTKALYIFVAGNVEDMKYGTNEKELLLKLEEEYGIKPVVKESFKSKSGTWKNVVMKDFVDFKGDICDVDSYYQFKDDMIYMVLIYSDKESENETHILNQLKLMKKAIVKYKNESPVTIEKDGTGSFEKTMEDTEYKMYFPEDLVKNAHFVENEQYVEFTTEEGSIITCRGTKNKEKIKGYYKEDFKVENEESIEYGSFKNNKEQFVEYEYCVRKMYENSYNYLARVQITNGGDYYILDINSVSPIEDMQTYLEDYYIELTTKN